MVVLLVGVRVGVRMWRGRVRACVCFRWMDAHRPYYVWAEGRAGGGGGVWGIRTMCGGERVDVVECHHVLCLGRVD
jgi:hypothetical protein